MAHFWPKIDKICTFDGPKLAVFCTSLFFEKIAFLVLFWTQKWPFPERPCGRQNVHFLYGTPGGGGGS